MDLERLCKLLPDAIKNKDESLIHELMSVLIRNGVISDQYYIQNLEAKLFKKGIMSDVFAYAALSFVDELSTCDDYDLWENTSSGVLPSAINSEFVEGLLWKNMNALTQKVLGLFEFKYSDQEDLFKEPIILSLFRFYLDMIIDTMMKQDLSVVYVDVVERIVFNIQGPEESLFDFMFCKWEYESDREAVEADIREEFWRTSNASLILEGIEKAQRTLSPTYADAIFALNESLSTNIGSYLRYEGKGDKPHAWLGTSTTTDADKTVRFRLKGHNTVAIYVGPRIQ